MMPTAVSIGRATCSGMARPSRMAAPAKANSVSVWPSPQVRPCLTISPTLAAARGDARDRRDMVGLQRVLHAQQKTQPQNSEHTTPARLATPI